jgi:hypothetical protein
MSNRVQMPQGAAINMSVQAHPADMTALRTIMQGVEWPAYTPQVVNANNVAIIDPFDAYGPPDDAMLYPDEDDPEFYEYHDPGER